VVVEKDVPDELVSPWISREGAAGRGRRFFRKL